MTIEEALQIFRECKPVGLETCNVCKISENGICDKFIEIEDILDSIEEGK